ncbi:hypothetical protein SAMN06269117_1377 [Balnearium lithotrophicum]|uniref:DUF2232 domain-containing protein n=1 Tax=Balnearium lithotrophicum TaxID=223788 RepID=A0A521ECT9_9BACT|nr:hypothetical protein [Balnearium lithotrophicum]SMO81622.1 hypothetical protein SAMN06269117_1377 [Balnearium lithotrophicum]
MERLKPLIVLFLLTVSTGLMLRSPSLIPFGLGLSIFIPPVFIRVLREYSLFWSSLLTFPALLFLFFLNRESLLDVSSVIVLGALFFLMKNFSPSITVTTGGVFLTFVTVLEETLFGLPKEVGPLKELLSYRYGIYFFSSSLFSYLSYGISRLFCRELRPLSNLKYGFWLVILFILSALGVVLKLSGVLGEVSKNLLIVSISLISLQGLTVSLWFWSKLSNLWKLITGISIIIFPAALFVLSAILGLLDYMLNFRKLEGGEENESNTN